MTNRYTAVIRKEGDWYIAYCVELSVVSQGRTIEDAQKNLAEAVELFVESFGVEDLPQMGRETVFYPFEVAVGA